MSYAKRLRSPSPPLYLSCKQHTHAQGALQAEGSFKRPYRLKGKACGTFNHTKEGDDGR